MNGSVANVKTHNAGSYLRKLCQHWSHRFPVEYTSEHGTIELPQAKCALEASPEALIIRLHLQEGADEAHLRQVVEEHIRRFAFREELIFAWTPVPA